MATKKLENSNWIRTFEVIQPVRHRKGFTVYKVSSKVFLKGFPESVTTLTVWKRYNDFRKLYDELELIHRQLYLRGEVPKFPKGRVFGRFEYEVVEERRKSAVALLDFAATHSQLFTSKVFNRFFEEGYNSKDLVIDPTATESVADTEINIKPVYSNTCLIPEKLWTPPNVSPLQKDDGVSVSSEESHTPDSVITATDSDSIMSGSILSLTESSYRLNSTRSSADCLADVKNNSTRNLVQPSILDIPCSSLSFHAAKGSDYCEAEGTSIKGPISTVSNSASMASLNPVQTAISIDKKAEIFLETRRNDSCSGASSEAESSHKKKRSKPKGLSFFHFLPKFTKRDEKMRRLSEEKLLCDYLSTSYICEAAGHFAVAKQCESNDQFSDAFSSYKEGIRILLLGAKTDHDPKRKLLVRSKLDKYLSRAEALHSGVLDPKSTNHEHEAAPILSSLSSTTNWPVTGNSPNSDAPNLIMHPFPIEELKSYKIVRIIHRKVYTVVNIAEKVGGCFAMKVLPISVCPVEPDKTTIIPQNVPFMVKLLKWFRTDHSYILLMQYAGGGRLNDFVRNYQTKKFDVASPIETEYIDTVNTGDGEPNSEHVKILSVLSALAELEQNYEEEQENCESYTKLFEDYSQTSQGTVLRLAENNQPRVPFASSCQSKLQWCIIVHPSRQPNHEDTDVPGPEVFNTNLPSLELTVKEACDENKEASFESEGQHPSIVGVKHKLSWSQLNEATTDDLIESSRTLIQTVSRTLGSEGPSDNGDSGLCSKSPDSESSIDVEETLKANDIPELPQSIVSNANNSQLFLSCKHSNGYTVRTSSVSSNSGAGAFLSRSLENISISGTGSLILELDNEKSGAKGDDPIVSQEPFTNSSTHLPNAVPSEQLPIQRFVPECCVKVWGAEMVICLENLHQTGLAYIDLQMKNVLLGENGHILLSFRSQWSQVDQNLFPTRNPYSAPELCHSLGQTMWKIHPSCDFWSLGAILFELFTGQSVHAAHPEGFHPQTLLRIPDVNILGDPISADAKTLLAELLQFTPSLRLGYYGAAEIKNHPLFEGFDWESAIAAVVSSAL